MFRSLWLGSVFALTLWPLATVRAQEQESPRKIPVGSPLRLLDTADALAEFGRETGNALALTVAAGLAKQAGERARPREVEHQGPAPEAADALQPAAADVLEEAAALAKGDPVILALIADIRAASAKGLSQGLGASIANVPGSGADWYRNLPFKGGEYAETKVDVLNRGDVRLFVYDAEGNLVCKDASASGRKYCGWSPSSTDKFSIKIENRGAAPVRYKLVTN